MSNDNILIIVGAGASKALNKDAIPVMRDFFRCCVDLAITHNDDVIALALAACDYEHCFESQSKACQVLAAKCVSKFSEDSRKEDRDRARDSFLKVFKDRLESLPEEKYEDLEKVMQIAARSKEQPYQRLLFAINQLFHIVSEESDTAAHANSVYFSLFDQIGLLDPAYYGRRRVTFISFNYDLFLDNALWSYLRKYDDQFLTVNTGRKLYIPQGDLLFSRYIQKSNCLDLSSVRGHQPNTKPFGIDRYNRSWPAIKLLKPHGSLNWYWDEDRRAEQVILVVNDDEKSYAYNNSSHFNILGDREEAKKSYPVYVPLLVPPVKNKVRSHPLFWYQDSQMRDALCEAGSAVIIGWSMPDTDMNYQSLIERQIESRTEQIKEMTIIDPVENGQQLFDKFDSLFRPKTLQVLNESFSESAVAKMKTGGREVPPKQREGSEPGASAGTS